MKNEFEKILIMDRLHLIGNPPVNEEPCFNLLPGDKVWKIGRLTKNGKVSSSSRVLEFDLPVTYKGTITIDESKHIVFQYHPNYIDFSSSSLPKQDVYLVFIINDDELIIPIYNNQSIAIYKAFFDKISFQFNKRIKWAYLDKNHLQNEPFWWGSRLVAPGHIIEHLGRKDRSSFKVTDAVLKYSGCIGNDLYFSLVNDAGQTSETDGWYVELSQVNRTTLLAQTAHNAFYDIKY